jgi:hypothetical protein
MMIANDGDDVTNTTSDYETLQVYSYRKTVFFTQECENKKCQQREMMLNTDDSIVR